MGVPQIIVIVLYALGIGIAMCKHGEARTDKYNFFTALISTAINIGLLWWGGFFG